MATASVPFPTTATYPPPPFSGAYHHPSPFFYGPSYNFSSGTAYTTPASGFFPAPAYGAPPGFSYADTSPYPSPASAYTVATGFFPTPAYGHSTIPFPATSHLFPLRHDPIHLPCTQIVAPPLEYESSTFPYDSSCPMRETTPIPTQVDSNRPPPTPTTIHGDLSLLSIIHGRPKLQQDKEEGGETKEDDGDDPASPTTASKMQPDHAPMDITTSSAATPGLLAAASSARSTVRLFCGAKTAPTPSYSPATLASTPLSGFRPSTNSTVTVSTNSGLLSSTPSVFPVSSYTMPSVTAFVAPQVFGEMPTPRSGYDYGSRLHNTTLTTCVSDSNLSEQHFDGIPQANGFHKLGVLEPVFDVYDDEIDVCSTEFVDVLAGIRVQQTYEENQQESVQLAKCFGRESENASSEQVQVLKPLFEQLLRDFSKVPETEQTSADVLDSTFEQQQQNDEKAPANVQQLRDPQVNVLVIHERRKEWDPGEHAIRSSTRNTDIAAETYALARASPNSESDGCSNDFVHVYTGTHEQQAYEEEQCESRKAPECFSKLTVAIDDIFSFTNERKSDAAILAVCYNNASDHAFSEEATDLTYPAAPALHADRYIKLANKESTQVVSIPCVQEATMHCDVNRFEIKINKQDVLIHKHGITYHSDLNTDMEVPFALQYQLPLSSAPGIWDPSIAISHLLIFIGQPVDLKQFWSQLLLQRHCWYTTPNALLQKQYFYLPVVLDCLYSETVKQLFCYSSMFHSAEAIHSVMSMSTATTVRLLLVLSSWKIAQEGRDAAAVYHVGTIQLPMRKTSHNPGTMLFLYKSKWRLRYMEEKINWHKDIKFYQVTLWLIHFLPP